MSSGNSREAESFATFFGILGALTGCSVGLQAAQGSDDAWIAMLVGLGLGGVLGRFVGHVVWRILLIAFFLLFMWLRMEACSAIRNELSDGRPTGMCAFTTAVSSPSSAIRMPAAVRRV